MIIDFETIDHENPASEKIFKRVVDRFRKDCLESVISRQSLRKGGRTLRREIDRKNIDETTTEDGNKMTLEMTSGKRIIGRLTVELENTPKTEESCKEH